MLIIHQPGQDYTLFKVDDVAGRITYKHPEIHSDGGWITPFEIPESSIAELEQIIGRSLTISEIKLISRLLSDILLIKTSFIDASMQDVKRTLNSLIKSRYASTAYRNSDSTTQYYIDEALACDLELTGQELLYPTDEAVNVAARIALGNLPKCAGGRPTKYYRIELSRGVELLWLKLKLTSYKTWARDDKASAKVKFLKELLILIDRVAIDLKEIVHLFKNLDLR